MIKQIRLKNYILIDELSVNFDNELNIITGETGAGKSILINAIDLVFAPRVSKEVIKTGTDKALIEIILENTKHNLDNFFNENGVDNIGDEIIISKEITQNSVRSRINGTLVNQEVLKELKTKFVDIHSQNQTYTFLQPQYHIGLLDSYAKDVYGNLLDEYKNKFKKYETLKTELVKAQESANMTEAQIDFLKFQINEIESANIETPHEDEKLNSELEVLSNGEKLKELTAGAYWALNGEDGSIIEGLNSIKANLTKASAYDKNLEEIEEQFTDNIEVLRDLSSALREYSQNIDNDAQRLNEIQERLFIFDKLKRKYGGTLEEVLNTYEASSKQLKEIDFSTQNIENLKSEITKYQDELTNIAARLTSYRKDYAQVLSSLIQEKLEKLELPKTKFEIQLSSLNELNINGLDSVEFMISTNISEGLKPLIKVASGGEISRIILAIKSIFAQNDDIDTVIFDEIDTGISGHASQSVADEILNLSKYHQIIAITHQPIIASKATKHFYVRKSQQDETVVEVYVLDGMNKVKALAELAGGEINEQSVEFAKSLLTK